jgi:competence protein ComEC
MTVAKNRLVSDIIIVPHHGSLTSSTLAFIQAIQPNYALFAVGYHNRYKLPKLEIVQRYQKLGSKTLDTSQCGAIIFTDKLAPDCYRESHRHVWNR